MTVVDGTTPYAWPYDGVVDPDVTALLVAGGGPIWSGCVPRDDDAASNIAVLREQLSTAGVLVVIIDHRPVFARVRAVAEAAPPLAAVEGELTVMAAGLDGFYGSALDAMLQSHRRTHLLVCGNGLETTVHGTIRRANDRGYECLMVIDASPVHDRALTAASRSSIEMSGGIFGAVGTTDAVLAAYVT